MSKRNLSVVINEVLFKIPYSLIDDVQAWVHEFSEHTIYKQIANVNDGLKDKTLRVSFNGALGDAKIAHVLVALHCISAFGERILTPEEFEHLFLASFGSKPK